MKEANKRIKAGDSELDRLREATGLTQEEFCRRCGIPLRTYVRWISGQAMARPTIPQVKSMCRELRLTIEELPEQFGPPQAASSG